MLYHFLVPFADEFSVLNVFRYLTFRTGGAVLTALVVSFMFGPVLIEVLKARQKGGQPIRADGPETHLLTKQGTPTMGGVLILLALGISTILWADLSNGFLWSSLGVTLAFGAIGFFDAITNFGNGFLGYCDRICSHVGDQTNLMLIDINTFIELLGNFHGFCSGEAKLVNSFLL